MIFTKTFGFLLASILLIRASMFSSVRVFLSELQNLTSYGTLQGNGCYNITQHFPWRMMLPWNIKESHALTMKGSVEGRELVMELASSKLQDFYIRILLRFTGRGSFVAVKFSRSRGTKLHKFASGNSKDLDLKLVRSNTTNYELFIHGKKVTFSVIGSKFKTESIKAYNEKDAIDYDTLVIYSDPEKLKISEICYIEV